ncbi:MAG: hypothetical protein JNK82_28320 [Myxococcaceae bacterium]|nr:hypothetical protein [Myxococcaceae bacterium]
MRAHPFVVALVVLLGCNTKTTPLPGDLEPDDFPIDSQREEGTATKVQLGACPTEREPIEGKLAHQTYVDAHPGETHLVNVMLRANSLPQVPACDGDDSRGARCTARDLPLHQRGLANDQAVTCVLQGLSRIELFATWYEEPYFTSDGNPTPVGLGFTLALSATQARQLAAHPFVWRVEPAFGEALRLGVTAPYPPFGCPSVAERGEAKLADVKSIEGRGRRPVLIDLKHDALPEGLVAQTVMGTRNLTCVRRAVDLVAKAPSPGVAYGSSTGDPRVLLPPFGQSAGAVKTFGAGLTWEEAQRLAQHPLVERIWTFEGLEFDEDQPGCPPDLTKPIPTVTCPAVTEPIDAKLSADDRRRFEQADATTKHDVVLQVRGGAKICRLPQCPPPPAVCEAKDQLTTRWRDENAEAQRCVRDAITAAGATADADVLWLVNIVSASLTWAQLQAVAAHPHVLQVEAGGEAPPTR